MVLRRSSEVVIAWDFRSDNHEVRRSQVRSLISALYRGVILDKKLYFTLSLSPLVKKWVLANGKGILTEKLEGNPAMD